MSELKKTLSLSGAAVVLCSLALVSGPRRTAPDAFFDVGQPFFPAFTDPQQATTLEIVEFNQAGGAAIPFKVTSRNGLWTIPSHHDYPADGKDRLATTAAAIISLVKADFRTDKVTDHVALGVVDPLDEKVSTLQGRGTRLTVKDRNDTVLADLVIGKDVEGGQGSRFVRVAGRSRVYAAKLGAEISTKFEDWIERDLLQLDRDDITRIVRNDYQIEEEAGGFAEVRRGTVALERGSDAWTIRPMSANQEVDKVKMNELIGVLDELMLAGVRPKPPGVTQNLRAAIEQRTITRADLVSLQSRGFYVNPQGAIYSNQGELLVWSRDSVKYTLRFGQVVYGSGDAVTLGTEASDQKKAGAPENRYMMISAEFDPAVAPEPPRPGTRDFEKKPELQWTDADRRSQKLADEHASWERRMGEGKKRAEALAARFAKWYYVISSDSFERLRIGREKMLEKKGATAVDGRRS